MKYGNRSIWNRIISSPISIIVLAVLVFVLARAASNIGSKVDVSGEKLAEAQAEYDRSLQRQRELSKRVEYLSTEQGIESEIRTKYHAVREGEEVAVIVDGAQTAAVVEAATGTEATTTPGFWSRLLHSIGL